VILLEDVAFVRRQTKRKSTNLTAMNISTLLSSGGTDGGGNGDNGSGNSGGGGGGSNSNNNSASNNNHNNSSSGSNGAMSHIDSNLAVMAKDPESMLGNRLGQILKKKKLEPLDFVEEKKEIDGATKPHIESSWWDSDLAIPFCKMSLDVMTDWSRHFSELMNEENVDLFERVFDLLCKIAVNVGLYKKALTENNGDKMKNVEAQQLKLVEQCCIILDEDVVPRNKGLILDETSTSVIKLFRMYWETMKKERDVFKDLQQKRKKLIKDKQETRSRGFRVGMLGGPRAQSTYQTQAAREFYNLPDGSTQFLLQINDCLFALNEKMEISLSLYSTKKRKIVSEEFIIPMSSEENSITIEDIKRVVIQDVGADDIKAELHLVARIYRIGQMLRDTKKQAKEQPPEIKRPYGCSVFELSPSVISTLMAGDKFAADQLPVYIPTKEENFATLHEYIIEGKQSEFESAPANDVERGISLALSAQIGEYDELLEKQPEWGDAKTCKLMNFPAIVSPGEKRNDIYVTIGTGNFKNNESKNILVEARVVYQPEEPNSENSCILQKCLTGGIYANTLDDVKTVYSSTVYYHNKSPKWNETFKFDISPEHLDKATVVFLFTNVPSRHSGQKKSVFAIASWKVTDKKGRLNLDSKIKYKGDDEASGDNYTLSVYKYSKLMEDQIHKFSEMHELRSKMATKDTLNIKHTIVSTRVTKNENLRNLLNWRKFSSKKEILDRFLFCQIEEKVTFLREIFDAMLSIMDEYNDRDVALLIYEATNDIIGNLVSQRKFEAYRDIMDQYIANHFRSIQAQKWFLHFLLTYLSNLSDAKNASKLQESIKGLDYLFKFIVKSRQQYEESVKKGERVAPDTLLESSSFYISRQKKEQLKAASEAATKTNESTQPAEATTDKSVPTQVGETVVDSPAKSPQAEETLEELIEKRASARLSRKLKALEIISAVEFDNVEEVVVEKTAKVEPKNEFQRKVLFLLDRVYELLQSEQKFLVGAKANLLKFVGSLFDSLAEIFDPVQVAHISATFLSHIPKPKSTGQSLFVANKLHLITQLVKGKVFKNLEGRRIILPKIIEELQYHFNKDQSDKACIEIFSELLHAIQKIYNEDGLEAIKDSMYTIFTLIPHARQALDSTQTSIDALKQSIEKMKAGQVDKTKSSLSILEGELQASERMRADLMNVLLAFVYQYRTDELMRYHRQYDEDIATGMNVNTIKQFLSLNNMFLTDLNFIPENFIAYNVIMYKTVLTNLSLLANLLQEHFQADDALSYELFDFLFKTMFKFVFSPYIQLETSTSFKQAKITALAGDLRLECLKLILKSWNTLGALKEKFVPALINPIMKVLDIRNESLHNVAVDLFFASLQHEFKYHGTLERCESVTQRCIIERTVDDLFRKSFMEGLENRFKADDQVGPPGFEFLKRLATMLADVVKIQQYADNEDFKTQACIQVMESLKTNGNIELYLKYVHILSDMHIKFGNHIEAVLCLKLHYDTVTWDVSTRLPYFSEQYPEETAEARKEKLCKQMIYLCDQGKDWEKAIELCKELRTHYEKRFAYLKIEDVLKDEGTFYTSIMTKKRFGATYFYVRYYGLGFKELGLNGEYIYRGKELENHMEFAQKLISRYPGAKVIETKDANDALDEKPGMFIIAYTVIASDDDEMNNVFRNRDYNISPKISRYDRINNIKCIISCRSYKLPNANSELECKDLYRENKYYVLEDRFPSIKRRMRAEITINTMTPLEHAIKILEDKVKDLQDFVISHHLDVSPDTGNLTMLLNGVLDAAVNGGTKKYMDAFLTGEYLQNNPQEAQTLERLKKALVMTMDVSKEGLVEAKKRITGKGLALCEHLELRHEQFKEQLRVYKVTPLAPQ